MIPKRICNHRGVGLVSILISLVIIGLMFCFMTRNQKTPDNANQKFINDAGIDTSSYKGILDSTKKTLQDAQDSREQIPEQ